MARKKSRPMRSSLDFEFNPLGSGCLLLIRDLCRWMRPGFGVPVVLIGLCGVLVGCNGYHEVACYECPSRTVTFVVRDPNWCDVARVLEVDVVIQSQVRATFVLTLLECGKTFPVDDYAVVEDDNWVVLMESSNSRKGNKSRFAEVIVKKENEEIHSADGGVPDSVMAAAKSLMQQD
jgi:hypothetical protein